MKSKRPTEHQGEPGVLFLIDALGTLRGLVNAIGRESDGTVLVRVVRALMELQEVEGCAIFLQRRPVREGDEAALDLRVARGLETPLAELAARLSTAVIKSGGWHYEPDLARRTYELRGSLAVLPISLQGDAIGALVAWSHEPSRYQQWHQNLLELFCDVLGLYFVRHADAAGGDRQVERRLAPRPQVAVLRALSAVSDSTAPTLDARLEAEPAVDAMDPLTGLLDRASFERRIARLLGDGVAERPTLHLLYIDIDRYRLIRQFGGDQTADRVTRILAETVRRQVGQEIALGRLGPDELGVLVSIHSLDGAVVLAQRLIRTVDSLRLSYAGQPMDVSVSIGVAPFSSDWLSSADALRQAQEACNAAQRHGGGSTQVYTKALGSQARSRDDGLILSQLTCALKEDRLQLYAQPIVPAQHGSEGPEPPAKMYEVLLRLQDQRGGVLPAATFLPLAERYGLSTKLDRWVIRRTLQMLASAGDGIGRDAVLAVNLSGHSIDDPRLLELIVAQFGSTSVAPERICFEITETAAISDIQAAQRFMRELKNIGCRFALDDFGSGHSSFLYLRDLEVDYLKIEGNLVRDITQDPVSYAFVRSIDDIGKIMGKLTIAEHVESPEVLAAIREIGIDMAQGYCIGRPMPLASLLKGEGARAGGRDLV